jgi:hypothetical protein
MKIQRKEFHHPDGSYSKDFLWWGHGKDKKHKKQWIAKTLAEIRQDVADFINGLGPDKLVSINEYTTAKELCGDDAVTHWVVWYWAEEETIETPATN